ncbi:ABC transporter ATP-binding protein [Janibacter cremeus]|uniref:ABC-2 type transport system ATP-binding protein n=1 Tax=Janibacter cremeus TaxID=1285192 RepID=A0A852VWL6_9MICO|nr:ABC transporter ATP-binding protein [Janibacter cremeus]NYF98165.1 ABC-2 type transport system ATP-binding protein [Janibacter cremeus]
MSDTPVIDTRDLHKRYGSTHALDGLDLDVAKGEVHGFLGPNGAGKSTTIRVLLGLTRADSGDVSVLGGDPWHDAVELHRRLAYVPAGVTLWPGLTGGQCIDVLGRAHGGIDEARREQLVERFDLDTKKRTRDYSTGNKQKVSLIAALAADVDLLLLDEPTSGLDPLMEQVFQETVRERVAEGTTVLLSSHILGEVEALADRVSIIRAGRTVTTGTLTDLRRSTSSQVHAVTDREVDLESVPGVSALETSATEGRPEVRCHVDATDIAEVVGRVHAAGVHTLTITPPSLDDLFLEQYRDTPAEGADTRQEAIR